MASLIFSRARCRSPRTAAGVVASFSAACSTKTTCFATCRLPSASRLQRRLASKLVDTVAFYFYLLQMLTEFTAVP